MLPDTIDVIIPKQSFSSAKYMGFREPCYLEEQLIKLFPENKVMVVGHGRTRITTARITSGDEQTWYEPTTLFTLEVVESHFQSPNESTDIHLTLKKVSKTIEIF